MAPDSKLWHRLGEATTGYRNSFLTAAVSVCVLLTMSASNIEARMETAGDPLKENTNSLPTYEKLLIRESLHLNALLPPDVKNATARPASSAAQWSNRNQIPIPNEPCIQKHIRYYKGVGRSTMLAALNRAASYAPVMAEVLETKGVPVELLGIVVVESGFQRHASNAGAKGYWQLIGSTARKMGLRVDQWVDERVDPVKSTEAAAKYLRSFYERYGSWPLALAAYNSGGGPVESALRGGRGCDYWEIAKRGKLPGHTLAFVPKVLAAAAILQDLETHGFKGPRSCSLYDFETISVQAPLRLDEVARWVGTPVSRIQDLNPSLCLDRVPPNTDYNLRLPSGTRDTFDLAYQAHLRK